MSATTEYLLNAEDAQHTAEMAAYDSVLAMYKLGQQCWLDDDTAGWAPTSKWLQEQRECLEEALEYLAEIEAAAEQLKS